MNKTTNTISKVHTQAPRVANLGDLERFKLLIDTVQDYAIFLLDESGHVKTWNRGAEKIKGYKPNEIIGKHFSIFYMPEDVLDGKPARELELAQKFGRVEDEDWRVRKDGTKFWANVVITALYENDKLVGFAKVTRDLTERKQHEDELLKANVLLKAQQQELKQLNISKDEFISLASHQLRTPATIMKQLLGIALDGMVGELPPEAIELLEKAYESNERQITIVNSLLKVAQVDAGKVKLHRLPTDISKMLVAIMDEHADTFYKRDQHVTVNVDEAIGMVLVDPTNMRMALENIVDNASKYTPHGGEITVEASVESERLRIDISDTGVGIDAADISKLYKKFVRLPNSLSSEVNGSGLGLYWVDKIIQLHGGSIHIQSEVEKGTTFTISLPLERDAHA